MNAAAFYEVDFSEISRGEISRKTGYSMAHISRVMSGQTTPSMKCAAKIASVLGVSIDAFYNWQKRQGTQVGN